MSISCSDAISTVPGTGPRVRDVLKGGTPAHRALPPGGRVDSFFVLRSVTVTATVTGSGSGSRRISLFLAPGRAGDLGSRISHLVSGRAGVTFNVQRSTFNSSAPRLTGQRPIVRFRLRGRFTGAREDIVGNDVIEVEQGRGEG